MRIVQLIDSLEPGGAERMAVSYANGLENINDFSALVVTRNEGALKHQLNNTVKYDFLQRKKILDFKALFKFRKFLIENKIDIIHAHSTSVYFAVISKIIYPKVKIYWHDHYGKSEMLKDRKKNVLQVSSLFLEGIITVNQKLKNWSSQFMYCKKVTYLPNFTGVSPKVLSKETALKGVEGKRIICLANLRAQKNHKLILEVAKIIKQKYSDWSFHLVGKDFNDGYSNDIKKTIEEMQLQNNVFLYGSRDDISAILKKSTIGILTSFSEGLPVALLEYGFQKLGVVATRVGEIPLVIKNNINGLLVESNKKELFASALVQLIENKDLRIFLGEKLFDDVVEIYSEKKVLTKYLQWINEK